MKTTIVCAILLVAGLVGCKQLESQVRDVAVREAAFVANTTAIADIPKQPAPGTTVLLQGRVGQHAPLLGGVVYELRDRTGSISVLVQGAAPPQGDEVVIRGVLHYQSIQIDRKEQGSLYVEQQELLQRQ
jgi:uncharacterized protein YdeI (BOF family)